VKILGIDPGLATVGYGVIEILGPRKMACISYGSIRTQSHQAFPLRLRILFDDLKEILERYNPEEVAVERLFFSQNVTTGIQVAHARGVLLLRLEMESLPLYEYTPLQIKSRVVGYGHAQKHQIQSMVQRVLSLEKPPKPDDAADGLAVAICHYYARMAELHNGGSPQTIQTRSPRV
jgi:crossover junction endodeoxyribonuclease RuvC